MSKEFWDFPENINYTNVIINNNMYKVLYKYDNYNDAAILLNSIRNLIDAICKYLYVNYDTYSTKNKEYIKCFLSIHNGNYLLSEMQLNTPFNGLNKPKNIYLSNEISIGKDHKLRAKNRDIFLTIRKTDGKFKSENSILKLVIHEITHTMCNHVRWRDDDHNEDFDNCEKLIISVVKEL